MEFFCAVVHAVVMVLIVATTVLPNLLKPQLQAG